MANAHSWTLHLSWRWLKATELQTCRNMGFRYNFSNSLARWHGPEPTIYRVLNSIWIFLKNNNPLLSTDVQSARGGVEQIQEFGKLVRATKRAQNSESYELKDQFVQICFSVCMARSPQFTEFWARLARSVTSFLVKQDESSLPRSLLPRDWTELNISRFLDIPG